MIKMFYSGTYQKRHELINKENVCEMLKDDVRCKIVGDVKKTIYSSDGVRVEGNPNILYIGGFYYEKEHPGKTDCENVVIEELGQIDRCDLIVVNLRNYSAIASVTEMIYGAMKNKKIIIFCDPKITSYKISGEYWFPILTAKMLDENVEVRFVESDDEIIEFVKNYKGDDINDCSRRNGWSWEDKHNKCA